MIQENRKRFFRRIEEKAKQLPWYVGEYIDKRKRKLSPASLLNYCHDFIIFFDWILAEQIFSGKRQDIPLETLEKLTRQQVEDFLAFLEYQLDNSPLTVNRKLSALKSLFHYLQNIAETPDLQPYLTRNVMAKVELNKIKEDQETLANRMEGKILRGDEYERFRQFIVRDYGVLYQDNKKIVNFHLKNRERDTAIVSLILGSGRRRSAGVRAIA